MTDHKDLLAAEFERHRARLRAVAYRMLGSVSDADDAVQESWLRLNRSDADAIANLPAWLTAVVARVSMDMLRARRARHEDYVGTWLPEPLVALEGEDGDPAEQALLADSVGLALLVVLDSLSPAERLAFVLHDMFAVPFAEIAAVVDTTPAAARQLASRARRRVRGAAPAEDADLTQQRAVVDAFLAASRNGDFEALMAVLHPDVVFRVDSGGRPPAGPPVTGAEAVARQILRRGAPLARFARPAVVNGRAGVVVQPGGITIAVVGFTSARGRVVEIDVVTDRRKLRRRSPES
jgi:RNA polymerase sigma factor (sigma-70 family)